MLLLEDMLTAMDKIFRYTTGLTSDQFTSDDRTVDAVVRNLEIVGEAARQIPDTLKKKHPEIPWRQISGMRNRIVHDYFGIDIDIVWQVVVGDLPVLRHQLSAVLNLDSHD